MIYYSIPYYTILYYTLYTIYYKLQGRNRVWKLLALSAVRFDAGIDSPQSRWATNNKAYTTNNNNNNTSDDHETISNKHTDNNNDTWALQSRPRPALLDQRLPPIRISRISCTKQQKVAVARSPSDEEEEDSDEEDE